MIKDAILYVIAIPGALALFGIFLAHKLKRAWLVGPSIAFAYATGHYLQQGLVWPPASLTEQLFYVAILSIAASFLDGDHRSRTSALLTFFVRCALCLWVPWFLFHSVASSFAVLGIFLAQGMLWNRLQKQQNLILWWLVPLFFIGFSSGVVLLGGSAVLAQLMGTLAVAVTPILLAAKWQVDTRSAAAPIALLWTSILVGSATDASVPASVVVCSVFVFAIAASFTTKPIKRSRIVTIATLVFVLLACVGYRMRAEILSSVPGNKPAIESGTKDNTETDSSDENYGYDNAE